MSSHITLTLHLREETVVCDIASALTPVEAGIKDNPISDYFFTTGNLVKKIIDTKYADDSEILGLLVLGVVSSAEFYFRSILGELSRTCPLCLTQAETISIPAGAIAFYSKSDYSATMSAFEHESLADSKKISEKIERFSGFKCLADASVKKALEDFELLCELRHCFIHARGFAGLKAIRALQGTRTLHKVLVRQQQALDFIKLAHNSVRAVNHYLSNSVLNRWIAQDVLSGEWARDKHHFIKYWQLFSKRNEDAYSGNPRRAYSEIKPIILKRRQAIAARVATTA